MGDEQDSSDLSTANTLRERTDDSTVVLWLLMSANRFIVTAVLAAFVFVGLIVTSQFISPPLPVKIRETDTIETIFSAMIGVVITGTTFVVTISQLVISQENGPLGDQRRRMSETMDFRTYTSELLGTVTPSDPSAFLITLINTVERRTEALYRLIDDHENEDLREQVDGFAESVYGNAEAVTDEVEGQQFGTFKVVNAALDFNYSWKLFHVERMMMEFEDDLTDEQMEAFDDLKTSLSMFAPAREHIKTLYFQWALIDLSRYILYAAIPALLVAGAMLTFVGSDTFSAATLGVPNATWVVSGTFTFTALPFLLFAAYIFRIITLAKRTLAIGPLILRSSQR